jgi:hypothetical protein
VDCCEPLKLGLGAIAGLESFEVGASRAAEVCCDSGLGWFTEFDSWRGFGGAAGLDDDGVEGVDEMDSPDGVRNPIGFLGGVGADFVLVVDAIDVRCACVIAAVSVFVRRNAGRCSGSSSGVRSMRFPIAGPGEDVLDTDLRFGRLGRIPG